MNKSTKLSLDDLKKVSGGKDVVYQYKCGDCGYEFNGDGDECPKCHGHWIGERDDFSMPYNSQFDPGSFPVRQL